MNDDGKFIAFSRQLLDDNLGELDESVLSRLRQSRQQAVNAAAQTVEQVNGNALLFPGWLAPVSTGATFATIALTITLFWVHPPLQDNSGDSFMEDVSLLSVSEDLEFYQNIEFYLWLEDETAG